VADARVTVVDYGASNLRSVVNALESLGRRVVVADTAEQIADATAIVLPGVGAFAEGMDGLRKRDVIEALEEAVCRRRTPYLGICLGMQFLAREGLENGVHAGLGWLPGRVQRLAPVDPQFKVPHIGWNDLEVSRPGVLFAGLDERPVVYFLHSYYFEPDAAGQDAVTTTCWHGVTIPASVERDNIFGVQFHPEKSQQAGLKVLENFLRAAAV
jgi:imidazole glycerol-phosphate synthase subunit HisH